MHGAFEKLLFAPNMQSRIGSGDDVGDTDRDGVGVIDGDGVSVADFVTEGDNDSDVVVEGVRDTDADIDADTVGDGVALGDTHDGRNGASGRGHTTAGSMHATVTVVPGMVMTLPATASAAQQTFNGQRTEHRTHECARLDPCAMPPPASQHRLLNRTYQQRCTAGMVTTTRTSSGCTTL